MHYTEEALEEKTKGELQKIVIALATKFQCDPEMICPIRGSKELFISSILEAQEQASGS